MGKCGVYYHVIVRIMRKYPWCRVVGNSSGLGREWWDRRRARRDNDVHQTMNANGLLPYDLFS